MIQVKVYQLWGPWWMRIWRVYSERWACSSSEW